MKTVQFCLGVRQIQLKGGAMLILLTREEYDVVVADVTENERTEEDD